MLGSVFSQVIYFQVHLWHCKNMFFRFGKRGVSLEDLVRPRWEATLFLYSYPLLKGTVQRKLRGVQSGINRKVLLQTCGAGHLFQFFFSLHPLISIKQLSATTAERIGAVFWIGVVLQFSGSTTPIGAIGAIAPHLLLVFNCKINLNFETLNTTNRCGATTLP
jgi:hypothetical protein